jgi:hypothetical protein
MGLFCARSSARADCAERFDGQSGMPHTSILIIGLLVGALTPDNRRHPPLMYSRLILPWCALIPIVNAAGS